MIRGSLQSRLQIIVLMAAIPAFVAHIIFQIYLDQKTASEHSHADVQDVAASIMPLLKNMLIIGDLAAVQETLDEVMGHGQFRSLRIMRSDGRQALVTGKSAVIGLPAQAPAWMHAWLDIRFEVQQFPIEGGGETYGVLVAEPSAQFLVDNLWKRFWAAAAIWLFTLLVFFTLLRVTLRHYLKPLTDLAGAARRLGEGDLQGRASVSDVPELAQTAQAFNVMAERLVAAQVELQQKVLDTTKELQNLIERIPVGVFKLHVHPDRTVRFEYVSPRWCEILGLDEREVYANPKVVFACLRPDARAPFDQLRDTAAAVLRPFVWEGQLNQSRSNRWLHVEAEPTRLADGGVLWEGIQYDITASKEREGELDRIAHYDALTGIPNRVLFSDRIQQALMRAKRAQAQFAVCYLDLDGFKPVNDRFGHGAGDMLLMEISRRLQASLRSIDTVARIGGDEFVLLLMDVGGREGCRDTLQRVLQSIGEPVSIGPERVSVSASIGVAIYPVDATDTDLLLRLADQAMYGAKQRGRSQYVFSSDEA